MGFITSTFSPEMVSTLVSALNFSRWMGFLWRSAISSATIKPTLCRVFSYLSPGLPRQTSSQLTPPLSFLKNMVVTS